MVSTRVGLDPRDQRQRQFVVDFDLPMLKGEDEKPQALTHCSNNGDITLVFAVDAQHKVLMKPVKVGLRLAGRVEILAGLTPGELVVVEGVQKLRPGASVELSGPEAAAPYTR